MDGTALVVDDSRAMRRILRSWMSELGYGEVHEAGNGVEALEAIQGGLRPKVALVDWNMPEMDGLSLVKELRSDEDLRDVVLVMVTSEIDATAMVRALTAGADEYVMKPVTKDVLAGKLQLLGLVP